MEFTREIVDALGAPFPEDEIEFLPRAHSNGKALGLAYIDARSVMRRLDAAVGPGNWSFDFDMLAPDGKMVRGKLTVLGVTKCDAGEGSTEDEVLKSAVSDALKRCAVHFGIGRYLYYLPRVWAPYDAQRRQFSEQPRLAPAAVDRALQICGISRPGTRTAGAADASEGNRREPARPAASTPRTPEPPRMVNGGAAGTARETEAEATARKSIWTTGAGREESAAGDASSPRAREASVTGAPESSGDRAAARGASRSEAPRVETPDSATPSTLACSREGCGKALTRGQHDVSVRAFGEPLCPACQKERARAAA